MDSCVSWEGRKRSQAPTQGLQEVVRKGNTPSSVTVLSHGRNPPTAQGGVLGGAAWPGWEETRDPEGAGKEGCRRAVCAVAWGGEDKGLGVGGSVQVENGGRQDTEVVGTGRTMGLTLKILGSHGRYVSRGGTWLYSGALWLPLVATRGIYCGGLWWTLEGQGGVKSVGLDGR